MPTLAEMRANPPTSRPETQMDLCLDGTLVARAMKLQSDLGAMLAQVSENAAIPQRVKVEMAEVRDQLAALEPDLAAASGTLTIRATPTSGEWRRFVDANPPRPEGQAGHERDQRVGLGVVNADALLDNLARYAHAWDGETLGPDDWARIEPAVHPGDLLAMAAQVVNLYEATSDFTLRRSALSATRDGLSDFAERESSASRPSDSMGGSPSESTEATTETASE